jgi:type I restriction enzyme M protein
VSNRISLDELERYLWNSAVLLRTNIDAGAYKQYIFPLLFFKRLCDVFDEECTQILKDYDGDEEALEFPENHRFIIPRGSHWNNVRNVSENLGIAILSAFRSIERANEEKLHGVFGEGDWTNKNRLPDKLLKDLIEHFSSLTLSLENCPEDELGQGYEYLIKKFADDSGHTAQEFYTNRTVVHLMTEILRPQSGESIYDPTCGSAGMLISAIPYLKEHGEEWRNVRIFGQEINSLTSAIARMNLFLHGIKDFTIVNDDTLARPAFIENGQLQRFDIVVANPPYSISQWNRDAFANDKYGRNFLGTPAQGRADYAFFQHILKSLAPQTGRCAILFPHGVLFRVEESALREKLIKSDLVDCVIGLAPNLFFNSPMEACIVVCRANKPHEKRGRILIINAVNEVTRKNAQSWLEDTHIRKIAGAYAGYADIEDFARVVSIADTEKNGFSLSIPLYVREAAGSKELLAETLPDSLEAWRESRGRMLESFVELTRLLQETAGKANE